MIIKTIPAGVYDVNCYVVVDEATKEAVIMDPGGDADLISRMIKSIGAKPKMILLTHGHFDHVGGVIDLKNMYNIPSYINEGDQTMMDNKTQVFDVAVPADKFVKDGDILKFGSKEIKCIATPGHSPGGMCYLIGEHLFTGDTLFNSSVGRSDLPGGNFNELIGNIKNKLLPLGDNISVYPGHGPSSTIKYEKLRNPFLSGDMYVY